MHETQAVQSTARELAAVGVDRELAAQRDAGAPGDEVAALAGAAEPESFEPQQGQNAEPVVDARDVDVLRGEVRSSPQAVGRPLPRRKTEVLGER